MKAVMLTLLACMIIVNDEAFSAVVLFFGSIAALAIIMKKET